MKFLHEFKEFAVKGNVVDLAVGVIIGAAFGKIVSSLVDNILMPIIGMILGGRNFEALSVQVGSSTLLYGKFISVVIDFTIIAVVLFLFIKLINKLNRKQEQKPEPVKSEDIKLLEEIRDELRKSRIS